MRPTWAETRDDLAYELLGFGGMTLITTPSAELVIGCAIKVHRFFGPGLFESVYQRCLTHEMNKAGIKFQEQVSVPVTYDGLSLGVAFRADFVVEDELIVEVKSLEKVLPVHASQVLTYMRLFGVRKGMSINFNVALLKEGIKSYVI